MKPRITEIQDEHGLTVNSLEIGSANRPCWPSVTKTLHLNASRTKILNPLSSIAVCTTNKSHLMFTLPSRKWFSQQMPTRRPLSQHKVTPSSFLRLRHGLWIGCCIAIQMRGYEACELFVFPRIVRSPVDDDGGTARPNN